MSNDFRSDLESSLGRSYTIESELSGGGMARVFLATERALGRRVVIKVLSPELGAEVSSKRFEREIRLAASLQQANIVPVLSANEAGGLPLYIMPFVDGLSLRSRLERQGRPSLNETVGILRDVARALAYAHEHGVVHRDIKPENVLLSGDAAVVTDFGIAKAILSARMSTGGDRPLESTVTQAGTSVGTPAYMAPEQISGDPEIDHRADLYSFGCVAYELLTGAPPFASRLTHGLFAAHLSEKPVPIGEKNPDTPPTLATMVMRCLEKEPSLRPQHAREILRTLEGVTAPATGLAKLRQRLTRQQRISALVALTALVIVAIALELRALSNARNSVSSVAVVPFVNVGGDSADDYLADGMADELATALGKIPGVQIVSRSASRHYKGRRDVSANEIGGALNATHVMQGSVRRMAGRLRMSAQLTSARDNREVWSQTYDLAAADVFAVPEEITRSIMADLRARIAGAAASAPTKVSSGTSNPDAYDLYLRGRHLLQRRGVGVKQATEKFAQAIGLDSNFARAHAALAFSLELLVYFEPVRTDSIGRFAIPAARRALRIDSTIAEAHTALALAYSAAYDWRHAEAEHRIAVGLEPNESDAHIQYGRLMHYTGREREAEAEFVRARELDPYSAVASGWLGHMYDLRGRSAEALTELHRALEIDSTNPPSLHMMMQAQLAAGNRAAARAAAEDLWRRVPLPGWRGGAAAFLATLGDSARARTILRALQSQRPPRPNTYMHISSLAEALGDTAAALDALERATAEHEPWPTNYSLSERRFDILRSSDRFRAIVRSVGLDESIFTSPTGGRLQ